MTAQPSLRHNLLHTLAGPTALLLLAAGAIAYGTAKTVVNRAYDQNLLNLAHGVATHVRPVPDGLALGLSPEAVVMLRTDTEDEIFFRVRDEQGRYLGGDADLPQLDEIDELSALPVPYQPLGEEAGTTAVRPPSAKPIFRDLQHHGQALRAVRLYRKLERKGVYVTVGETLDKRREAMDRLLLGFVSAGALLLLAAAVAARFGIPSGLAPLERLAGSLRKRSGSDLSPIDPATVPDEIGELVAALNVLFGRLREFSAQQREFLQDAAHQLRTPLAGLQMELELLESKPLDDEARSRLRQSVGRVTRLANQLLALARAEAGGRVVETSTPVAVDGLIDDMVEGWLHIADQRDIDLGIHRRPAVVAGDPTLLQELIANLMDNALKYTAPGGRVTLRCAGSENEVELSVIDDGPGIPEAVRDRVFERFYRHPGVRASGSGLGLSIAREIVRSHGGSIVIETPADGHGTQIRVRLPRVNDAGR